MANLNIKSGAYSDRNKLTSDELGFARLGNDATLLWKDGDKLREVGPKPGASNKPLVGQGTSSAPIYKTLPVAGGGTGKTTLTEGKALIGNGTSAVSLRSITNNTTTKHISASTNLITANTLAYWNGAYSSDGSSCISNVGSIEKGSWKATPIMITYGGTGATTPTEARANLGAASITFITWGKDDTYATIDG